MTSQQRHNLIFCRCGIRTNKLFQIQYESETKQDIFRVGFKTYLLDLIKAYETYETYMMKGNIIKHFYLNFRFKFSDNI